MTKAELFKFMAAQKLAVVGSVGPNDEPQSALVGIAVTEDLEIIFDTLKTTRKYRNLISDPRASLAIGWEGEQTVQLEGEASLPEGEALAKYKNIYFANWPDGPSRQNWPGLVYFVIRPKWIRYSDFDQQPPVIEEQVLDDPERL
jgi:general stress protein 26